MSKLSNIYHIYLFGEINYEQGKSVVCEIDKANQSNQYTSILLTICSPGGMFYPSFAMFDSIKNSKLPVDTIASGSCGTMLLQAGRTRYATKNSYIMIHPSNSTIPQSKPHEEFMALANQYDSEHQRFIELSASRSGMDKAEFDKLCKDKMRVYLSPKEALEFGTNGLIDKIIE